MLGLLLDTTAMDPVQVDYAETALSSGRALLSLVNDILDHSKIEAGCMQTEEIPFLIVEEVDGILSMFGERSRAKFLELASLIHSQTPTVVLGDPGRFRQIIVNLIGNALKFCSHGHILLRIAAIPDDSDAPMLLERFHAGQLTLTSNEIEEPLEAPATAPMSDPRWKEQSLSGHEPCDYDCCWPSVRGSLEKGQAEVWRHSATARLLIWVEDTGIGIPKSAKARIFTPFVQAEASTTRHYGGTGIGLTISKQLAEIMDGKVTFTSREGHGTTFRVDLKVGLMKSISPVASSNNSLRKSSKGGRTPSNLLSQERSCGLPPPTPPRVLYIDNNPMRAAVVALHLQDLGMTPELRFPNPQTVWSTGSPAQARDLTSLWPPPSSFLGSDCKSCEGGHPQVILVEAEPSRGCWAGEESLGGGCVSLEALLGKVREIDGQPQGEGKVAAPVVLISNSSDGEVEARARKAGFAAVLTKPLRRSAIAARLTEVLNSKPGQRRAQVASGPVLAADGLQEILRGKRFIVVDDNAINRKVASKILEKYGVVVTSLDAGQKVLDVLEGEHDVDMVLTDIQMPEMDGHEMTKAIRLKEKEGRCKGPHLNIDRSHVPILAMTADAQKGTRDKCLESGMDGFATKPIEEARLLKLVKDFLLPPDANADEE